LSPCPLIAWVTEHLTANLERNKLNLIKVSSEKSNFAVEGVTVAHYKRTSSYTIHKLQRKIV